MARLLADETFTAGTSYRAFRGAWVGRPTTPPDAVLTRSGGTATVHVSWNGATQVATWRVLSGSDAAAAVPVATMARTGFETAIPLPRAPSPYLEVQAIDASGKVLGSAVVGCPLCLPS